jgi:hypothetical protein
MCTKSHGTPQMSSQPCTEAGCAPNKHNQISSGGFHNRAYHGCVLCKHYERPRDACTDATAWIGVTPYLRTTSGRVRCKHKSKETITITRSQCQWIDMSNTFRSRESAHSASLTRPSRKNKSFFFLHLSSTNFTCLSNEDGKQTK